MKFTSLLICLLIVFMLLSNCGKNKKYPGWDGDRENEFYESAFVRAEYGIWITNSTLCENVVNREPINPAEKFYAENTAKLYLFTHIACKNAGRSIYHRYSIQREGLEQSRSFWEEVITIELPIRSISFKTWSYINAVPGKWRVDVLGPDRKNIMKSFFPEVTGPEKEKSVLVVEARYNLDQIRLIDSLVCEKIENNEPAGIAEEFTLTGNETYKNIWAVVTIESEAFPTKIFLRWSRWVTSISGIGGWTPEIIYDLDIKGKKWKTRGLKGCTVGRWRLDILAPDCKTIMNTHEFEVRPEVQIIKSYTDTGSPAQ